MNSILALTALTAVFQGPGIDQYTQPIKDIAFTVDVKTGNQMALRKISGDFGEGYRFEHVSFKIKDSFQIRGETKVDDTSVLMLMNNGIRIFRAPGKGGFKMDVRKKPGQRQTIFEFGIVTPDLFDDFMVSRFVRNDRATGEAVFDINFNPRFGDKTRYRVWIDPARKFTAKKEWYGQDGNLKATFLFTNPEKVGSFWVPTVATVMNSEGTTAGVLSYGHFRINAGMDDSIFK
ncbi:MAG TPA: outer membrane lipoprotein-sorting protein [Fimbriimonadaceae bacterium]|nr:outer membrane lipoprotein-sorting protein [Fimbriimonadaceae bacterium]